MVKVSALLEALQATDFQRKLMSLRQRIAEAAQGVYDAWEQDDDGFDEEFGGGGICDAVAQEIGSILAESGIDFVDGGQEGDDHAYLVAYTDDLAFVVDIPPGVYETGSGYSWKKVPDAVIDASDVEIYQVDREAAVG